jgi:hypothetical protein
MKGTPVTAGARGQQVRTAPVRVLACLLIPAALVVASGVLIWAASAPIAAVRAPGPAPVDALVALGAALVCAAVLALAAVGATLSLTVALTGHVAGRLGRLARLLTPRAVQIAVGLAVGVTVVAGPVAGPMASALASAATAPIATSVAATGAAATPGSPGRAGQAPRLPPGWSPDRPAADDHQGAVALLVTTRPRKQASTSRAGKDGSGSAGHEAVVVLRGDTLWAIAARHLGPGATDAQVAAEWPRWHAANRSTIGPDPDLILPGQRLAAPTHAPAGNATTDPATTDPATTDPATTDPATTASEESP